jgi:hypothetical protein
MNAAADSLVSSRHFFDHFISLFFLMIKHAGLAQSAGVLAVSLRHIVSKFEFLKD